MFDYRHVIIRTLGSQGCVLVEEDTTPESLCFKTEKGRYFFIPNPNFFIMGPDDQIDPEKFTQILNEIESIITPLDLELLPLNYH